MTSPEQDPIDPALPGSFLRSLREATEPLTVVDLIRKLPMEVVERMQKEGLDVNGNAESILRQGRAAISGLYQEGLVDTTKVDRTNYFKIAPDRELD